MALPSQAPMQQQQAATLRPLSQPPRGGMIST
jgi:hypothetical protein